MTLICYPKCSTCQKARDWLTAHGFAYTERDIKAQNPSALELSSWRAQSGLPLKRFFNTSGQKYRELGLGEKRTSMPEEEQLSLLASDGMLVKRPILLFGERVLVGFKPLEWDAALNTKQDNEV